MHVDLGGLKSLNDPIVAFVVSTRGRLMNRITPIIMCGGSGTRLWPASRESFPKQFIPLFDKRSTFQSTLLMVSDKALFETPIIITNHAYRFLVAEQLAEIGLNGEIILEPERKDSGPAVAVASEWVFRKSPHGLIAMMAADHLIANPSALLDAYKAAAQLADDGHIVTLGMEPTYASTGFGYIKPGTALNASASSIAAFVEKPNAEKAQDYLASGYLWNSGNFIFCADVMRHEISQHEPKIAIAAAEAIENGKKDLQFFVLDHVAFGASPKKSIDYAVMEHTKIGAVIPTSVGWSDVGNWDSVRDLSDSDEAGNVVRGKGVVLDGHDVMIRSDDILTTVVGLDNVIVITTPDAVLVVDANQAEKVKSLVEYLSQAKHREALEHRRIYRPWGYYQSVDQGSRYQVKRIVVKPKGRLSLQKHHHRSEHWIVVKGTAEVTLNDDIRIVNENESVYLPLGCIHRLANPGKIDLELIEVQTGSYFGEDDIVRIEDVYNRT